METIDSIFRRSCSLFPDKTAIRCKTGGRWEEISYSHLDRLSDRISAGLGGLKIRSGDKVAIIGHSSPQWVAAYLGILKAGSIVVPVDKELRRNELRHILSDCDARMVFCDPQYAETLLEIQPHLPLLEKIILLAGPSGDDSSASALGALHGIMREWRDLVRNFHIPSEKAAKLEALARDYLVMAYGKGCEYPAAVNDRVISMEQFLAGGKPRTSDHTPDETAVILYTSGTTGRSRGAMLSHSNIVANIKGMIDHLDLDSTISTLSFLPVNHVFEQVCGIMLPLTLGGTVSFAESLKKLGENLLEIKPTFFLGVPAVYALFLGRIRKNIAASPLSKTLFRFRLTRPIVRSGVRKKFGKTTKFISGGAPLDPAVVEGFSALGLSIYQGYGITETSPVISVEKPGKTRLGTVGPVLSGISLRIDRPNEEGIGEIFVKGPSIMQGYYMNRQISENVLKDGWYRTGDLGKLDEDGFLTICGRVKNLIVTPNGKNVYPEEIEIELLKSPLIAEAMVYGHKEGLAEEVHALIHPNQEALEDYSRQRSKGSLTETDVNELIRREVATACRGLADYKRIKKFTIREEEFPKTTTRKIKRFVVEADIPA